MSYVPSKVLALKPSPAKNSAVFLGVFPSPFYGCLGLGWVLEEEPWVPLALGLLVFQSQAFCFFVCLFEVGLLFN